MFCHVLEFYTVNGKGIGRGRLFEMLSSVSCSVTSAISGRLSISGISFMSVISLVRSENLLMKNDKCENESRTFLVLAWHTQAFFHSPRTSYIISKNKTKLPSTSFLSRRVFLSEGIYGGSGSISPFSFKKLFSENSSMGYGIFGNSLSTDTK